MTSPLSKTRKLLLRLEKAALVMPVGPRLNPDRPLFAALTERLATLQAGDPVAPVADHARRRRQRYAREALARIDSAETQEKFDSGLDPEAGFSEKIRHNIKIEKANSRRRRLHDILAGPGHASIGELEAMDQMMAGLGVDEGLFSRVWPISSRFFPDGLSAHASTGLMPLAVQMRYSPTARLEDSSEYSSPGRLPADPVFERWFTVFHESGHCEHFARGVLFDHPDLSAEDNALLNTQVFSVQTSAHQPLTVLREMLTELVADGMATVTLLRLAKQDASTLGHLAHFSDYRLFRSLEFQGMVDFAESLTQGRPALWYVGQCPHQTGRFMNQILVDQEHWRAMDGKEVFTAIRQAASKACLQEMMSLKVEVPGGQPASLWNDIKACPMGAEILGGENPDLELLISGMQEEVGARLNARAFRESGQPGAVWNSPRISPVLADQYAKRVNQWEDEAIARFPDEWASVKKHVSLFGVLSARETFKTLSESSRPLVIAVLQSWAKSIENWDAESIGHAEYWVGKQQALQSFFVRCEAQFSHAVPGCPHKDMSDDNADFVPVINGQGASVRVIQKRRTEVKPAPMVMAAPISRAP